MTFLTNPSLVVKKTPLIEGKCDEEVIEMHPPPHYWSGESRHSLSSLLCMTLAAFLVTLAGILTGLLLYRQYIRSTKVHRYQGFCTIPISVKDPALYESAKFHVMPLRWSSEADAQVVSVAGEETAEQILNTLQEELDIGDTVEKITVVDNGHHVNFIHDFAANLSGIIDTERCFMMDMDQDLVLSPETFVMSIEGGEEFDISHVRSTLRAVLPALEQLSIAARDFVQRCLDKPTYKLMKEEAVIIRKRDTDAPPHDYIQFSGRHVQEIEISNLADLLQHEQARRG